MLRNWLTLKMWLALRAWWEEGRESRQSAPSMVEGMTANSHLALHLPRVTISYEDASLAEEVGEGVAKVGSLCVILEVGFL